jgi:ankyrin repeat protein
MKEAVTDTSARVMIVSRNETTIRQSLLGGVAWRATEYKISPEDVRADTASYSTSIVRRRLSNKTEEVQRDISERMTERCSGQFLVLRMQEDCLDGGLNKKQLRRVIDEEPRGLERLYQRNWERITGSRERERCRAMSLLRWAAFSLRPLTVGEITEAVLIDEGCDDFPIDELPDAIDDVFIDRQILGLCMSLLEIRDAAKARLRTVHLTHFSVKEFLLQVMPSCGKHLLANETLQASNDARENHLLAKMSLLYLSYHRVWRQSTTEREDNFSMSFRDYAADSWHRHLKSGVPGNADLISLTVKFFSDTNPNWNAWREWFDTNERGGTGSITEAVPPNPLYYASKLNLVDIATCLIRQNPSLAAQKSSLGRTALATACSKGHTAIVELLLDAGADETGRDTEGRTSLHSASQNGHVEIVKLLLGKGADVAAASKDGWTSLDSASENGHVEVVKLLLGKGADVAAAGKDGLTHGWTSLHSASQNGHVEIVKLLLGKGASVAAANKDGWTSLHLASQNGHVEVIQLLLDKGADVAAANKDGWTSLHLASQNGHIEVVKLLLDKGADVAAANKDGWTSLHSASQNGHIEVVKLLLGKGADVAAASKDGWTSLHSASQKGHVEVVRLLLDKGADVAAVSKDGWTSLHSASRKGHVELIRFLLEHKGVLPSAQDNHGRTALFLAARNGHHEAVKMLLVTGRVDLAAADYYGSTPLSTATRNGHDKAVEALLPTQHPCLTSKDTFGRTLMAWARRSGSARVMKILFDNAPMADLQIGKEDSVKCGPVTFDPDGAWCDACTLTLLAGSAYYQCEICDGGNFHICLECFEVGITCRDDSHMLMLKGDKHGV